MSERKELVTITVHTDDDSGLYAIGELDFGVPSDAQQWIERKRKDLELFLRMLADKCRDGQPPFQVKP